MPSMMGNKYSYALAQIAKGVLYPKAYMLVQNDFYEYNINAVAFMMTQLTLKRAVKEWGSSMPLRLR